MLSTPCKLLAAHVVTGLGLSAGIAQASEILASSTFLRVGLGLSAFDETKFHDRDCSAVDPPALFGCGPGPDGKSRAARGEFDDALMLEAALGRRMNSLLEAEIAVTYRPEMEFAGQSNFSGIPLGTAPVFADGWNVSLMTNLRFYWETWLNIRDVEFRPFLTAGAGIAVNHIGSVEYQFNHIERNDRRFTQSGTQTDLAWSLGTGVEISLSERLNLQLSYRYVDLGEVVTDDGDFLMTRDDRADIVIQVDETKASLTSNEFLIGLSYHY